MNSTGENCMGDNRYAMLKWSSALDLKSMDREEATRDQWSRMVSAMQRCKLVKAAKS